MLSLVSLAQSGVVGGAQAYDSQIQNFAVQLCVKYFLDILKHVKPSVNLKTMGIQV